MPLYKSYVYCQELFLFFLTYILTICYS